MIHLAGLDPASFSLFANVTQLNRLCPDSSTGMRAWQLAALGGVQAAVDAVRATPIEKQTTTAYAVTTIWHEQRHFLDLLVTNYGALRFRQFVSLYANIPIVLDAAQACKRLVCPLAAYWDPVRSAVAGVSGPDEEVARLRGCAQDVVWRASCLRRDEFNAVTDGKHYEVGGEAQLEVLAELFQLTALGHYFGVDLVVSTVKRWPRLFKRPEASWFGRMLSAAGVPLEATVRDGDVLAVDATSWAPILYGALSCRVYGQAADSETVRLPSLRLYEIVTRINPSMTKASAVDVWGIVNDVCREVWGRTALEEIRSDLAEEEKFLSELSKRPWAEPAARALEATHQLRATAVDMLASDPEAFLDPVEYVSRCMSELLPIPVLLTPSGVRAVGTDRWEPETRYEAPDRSMRDMDCCYSLVPTVQMWASLSALLSAKGSAKLRFPSLDPWAHIRDVFAPMAKLLLNGFSHQTCIGPELFKATSQLQKLGVELWIEPSFRYPRPLLSRAVGLHEISGDHALECCLCQTVVARDSGFLLSPWAVWFGPILAALSGAAYGPSGAEFARTDWSARVVCELCYVALDLSALAKA